MHRLSHEESGLMLERYRSAMAKSVGLKAPRPHEEPRREIA